MLLSRQQGRARHEQYLQAQTAAMRSHKCLLDLANGFLVLLGAAQLLLVSVIYGDAYGSGHYAVFLEVQAARRPQRSACCDVCMHGDG
jgi:hypothetical protein